MNQIGWMWFWFGMIVVLCVGRAHPQTKGPLSILTAALFFGVIDLGSSLAVLLVWWLWCRCRRWRKVQ